MFRNQLDRAYRLNILSVAVILAFVKGVFDALPPIIDNRYVPYRMFRLVALGLQKHLNNSFLIAFAATLALLLFLSLIRLSWKYIITPVVTVRVTDKKRAMVFSICLICFISLIYILQEFNNRLSYETLHYFSLLGDAAIILFMLLLGWILTKVKWQLLLSNLVNVKYKKTRKASLALLALLVLFNVIIFIESKVSEPKGPNVIFICIDTLRADHLSCYGYGRKTSPFMDQLAKNGVMFANNISQSTWTKTSTASFITSSYEMLNAVFDRKSILPEDVNTLAEILRNQTYKTGAVIANPWLLPKFGFAQGFDYYDTTTVFEPGWRIEQEDLTKYIEKNKKGKFFLYVHFMDVHNHYDPPAPYNKMFTGKKGNYMFGTGLVNIRKDDLEYTKGLYDGEIRFLDQKIKEFFDYLKEQDLLENSLIIFNADHGEEFTEHGGMGHGSTLYNELLHVPFFIVNNSAIDIKNPVIDSTVRNIDIVPTILDILDIPSITKKDGVSLLPLIEGVKEPSSANSVLSSVLVKPLKQRLVSASKDKYKYISNTTINKKELYNIIDDPGEQVNLIETMPELSKDNDVLQLKKEIESLVGAGSRTKTKEAEIDTKTIKQLKSLGYLQ